MARDDTELTDYQEVLASLRNRISGLSEVNRSLADATAILVDAATRFQAVHERLARLSDSGESVVSEMARINPEEIIQSMHGVQERVDLGFVELSKIVSLELSSLHEELPGRIDSGVTGLIEAVRATRDRTLDAVAEYSQSTVDATRSLEQQFTATLGDVQKSIALEHAEIQRDLDLTRSESNREIQGVGQQVGVVADAVRHLALQIDEEIRALTADLTGTASRLSGDLASVKEANEAQQSLVLSTTTDRLDKIGRRLEALEYRSSDQSSKLFKLVLLLLILIVVAIGMLATGFKVSV